MESVTVLLGTHQKTESVTVFPKRNESPFSGHPGKESSHVQGRPPIIPGWPACSPRPPRSFCELPADVGAQALPPDVAKTFKFGRSAGRRQSGRFVDFAGASAPAAHDLRGKQARRSLEVDEQRHQLGIDLR